jgi:hypothetical protein
MKEKYPELTEKCKSCRGCNKLEDITFRGYYRCENYMRGAEDDKIQKQENNN